MHLQTGIKKCRAYHLVWGGWYNKQVGVLRVELVKSESLVLPLSCYSFICSMKAGCSVCFIFQVHRASVSIPPASIPVWSTGHGFLWGQICQGPNVILQAKVIKRDWRGATSYWGRSKQNFQGTSAMEKKQVCKFSPCTCSAPPGSDVEMTSILFPLHNPFQEWEVHSWIDARSL